MGLSLVDRIPFDRIDTFSRLFASYCREPDSLSDYFSGDFRNDDHLRRSADAAAGVYRDRKTLVEVLLQQNEAWDLNEPARRQIERLAAPNSVAVVTGQQVGLFAGPLYTLYKTVTTVKLARRLEQITGRPVVPVFWLEGEDHDFDEVRATNLMAGNEPVRLEYEDEPSGGGSNRGPVGRLVLQDSISILHEKMEELLPVTEFRDEVMALVRETYRPGATLRDAFARLMRRLFADTGLVFISADNARLKSLVRPLFRRELDDFEGSHRRMVDTSARLAESYHAQVHARPLNLFLLEENGRYPLEPQEGGFGLRGTDRRYASTELHALLETEPERFSPNVVLRPLVQDLLLPTAAYVAGPSEVAYFAQFSTLYEWAGIPMPIIYPRLSATLIEGKVRKVLDRYGLSVMDVGGDLESLFKRLVVDQMDVDPHSVFAAATERINEAVDGLRRLAEHVDPTLGRTAEATRSAIGKELDSLLARIVKAEKRNHETLRAQLEKVHGNLYPGGKPQERVLSVLHLMNKFGPEVPLRFLELFPDDTTHHVVAEL